MGRTTTTETVRQDQTQTRNPFAPTIPVLQSIIGEAQQATAPGRTFVDFAPESRRALDLLAASASEPTVGEAAAAFGQGLLSGDAPASALQTLAATAVGDPAAGTPALRNSLAAQREDITRNVLGRFSAAGRLPSRRSEAGPNASVVRALARELARQELPLIASQFNQDVSNRLDAARSLLGTTVQLGQIAPVLDQARLFGPELLLRVGGLREDRERERLLEPVRQLQRRLALIQPVARLGGETTSSGNTVRRGQRQEDPLRTALDLGLTGASLMGRFGLPGLGG